MNLTAVISSLVHFERYIFIFPLLICWGSPMSEFFHQDDRSFVGGWKQELGCRWWFLDSHSRVLSGAEWIVEPSKEIMIGRETTDQAQTPTDSTGAQRLSQTIGRKRNAVLQASGWYSLCDGQAITIDFGRSFLSGENNRRSWHMILYLYPAQQPVDHWPIWKDWALGLLSPDWSVPM